MFHNARCSAWSSMRDSKSFVVSAVRCSHSNSTRASSCVNVTSTSRFLTGQSLGSSKTVSLEGRDRDRSFVRKDGELTKAQELRRTSLLGSVGMLRVLGGVFHELRSGENPAELGDITEFFKRLDRHMAAPVADNSTWRTTDAKADFEPEEASPIMRQQNIVHLVSIITGWYKKAFAAL